MGMFRVVKERVANVDHELDLRGLGGDSILTEADPLPVLSCSGSIEVIKKLISIGQSFDAALTKHQSKNSLHFMFENKKGVPFKHATVELFGLFHQICTSLNQSDDVVFSFWLADRMKFHMTKTDSRNYSAIESAQPRWDSFLSLAYPLNIYLKQAGFNLSVDKNGISFSRKDAQKFVHENIQDAMQESAIPKKRKTVVGD